MGTSIMTRASPITLPHHQQDMVVSYTVVWLKVVRVCVHACMYTFAHVMEGIGRWIVVYKYAKPTKYDVIVEKLRTFDYKMLFL